MASIPDCEHHGARTSQPSFLLWFLINAKSMLNVSLPQFQVHSIIFIFHPFTSPGTFENVGRSDCRLQGRERERSASKNVWVAGCPLLLDTNQELRGSNFKCRAWTCNFHSFVGDLQHYEYHRFGTIDVLHTSEQSAEPPEVPKCETWFKNDAGPVVMTIHQFFFDQFIEFVLGTRIIYPPYNW